MAWFTFECPDHGKFRASAIKRPPNCMCPADGCSLAGYPVLRTGTSDIVEVLDNGLMERRVERLHNVEEIMEARSKAHDEATGVNKDGGDE